MEKAHQPSWFSLTPGQDEKLCLWTRDFSDTTRRVARISVTRSSNDDGKTTDPHVYNWVQFKLFKNIPPFRAGPDGYSYQCLGKRKNQQVSLQTNEAEKLLNSCYHIYTAILSSLNGAGGGPVCGHLATTTLYENFNPTEEEDAKYCHWYIDIYELQCRKIRVAYVIYNVKDPLSSLYVQIKLFTRKEAGQQFIRESQVTYMLDEFRALDKATDYFLELIEYSKSGGIPQRY